MKLLSKLLLAACTLGLSWNPAQAQGFGSNHTVGLAFRTDWQSNNSDLSSKEDPNDESKSSKFSVNYSRMTFRGNLNDMTSYRATLRFDRSFDPGARNDGTGAGLDYWYLDRKFSSMLTLRVGKIGPIKGSIEDDYSGMDVYHYSYLSSKFPGRNTGVDLAVNVAGQKFEAQVMDSRFDQKNHSSYTMTLAWYGDIANKLLEPIITYGLFPSTEQKENTTGTDGKVTGTKETDAYSQSQWGAGTKVNLGLGGDTKLQIDAEVGNFTTPEYDVKTTLTGGNSTTTQGALEGTVDNVVVQARLHTKMFKPFLKYSSDQEKYDGDNVGKYDRVSGGVEVFPDADGLKSYRVHAVFIQMKQDCDMGFKTKTASSLVCNTTGNASSDDATTNQFNVGVSARFN